MQTEVLRFIHPDYEVIVRTLDIGYSWERFKGRINYARRDNPDIDAPESYCRYTSKDECRLCLYSPITGKKTDEEEEQDLKAERCGMVYGQWSMRLANIRFVCSSTE